MPTESVTIYTGSSDNEAQESDDSTVFITARPTYNINQTGSTFWLLGLRFPGVNIPNGATINSAVLEFYTDGVNSSFVFDIHMEDEDDTVSFATDPDVVGRTQSLALTTWSALPATVQAEYVTTDDFTSGIQEVVDRAGWVSGNAMTVLLVGSTTDEFLGIVYGHLKGLGPRLTINFDGVDIDPTVITPDIILAPPYRTPYAVDFTTLVEPSQEAAAAPASLEADQTTFSPIRKIGALQRTISGVRVSRIAGVSLDGLVPIPETPDGCPGGAIVTRAGVGSAIVTGTTVRATSLSAIATRAGVGSAIVTKGC